MLCECRCLCPPPHIHTPTLGHSRQCRKHGEATLRLVASLCLAATGLVALRSHAAARPRRASCVDATTVTQPSPHAVRGAHTRPSPQPAPPDYQQVPRRLADRGYNSWGACGERRRVPPALRAPCYGDGVRQSC